MERAPRVAVVIPCYRVSRHILDVISLIGPEVARIYVVDDACPERSGSLVKAEVSDPRVIVITHDHNQGVGAATMTGYRMAIIDDCDILIKMDGDGQMDPQLIPRLVRPIANRRADYCKGNRFFDLAGLQQMPKLRIAGNAGLSLLSKLSSGYWNIFDPTNGFTAIEARVANMLPFDKISSRYFFETDILFRLNLLRAQVMDVPMESKYGDEESNLKVSKVLVEFPLKHFRNFFKRVFYSYFLRDMSLASFELLIGTALTLFGLTFGVTAWTHSIESHQPASAGTVMLAALPLLTGIQLLLAFLSYDIAAVPKTPLQLSLHD